MKKRLLLHISSLTPQTILFFGLVSLIFGGLWLFYVCFSLKAQGDLSYLSAAKDGLSELLFGVLIHFGAAGLFALILKEHSASN